MKNTYKKLILNGLILGSITFGTIEILHFIAEEIWINYLFKIAILSVFLGIYLTKLKSKIKEGTIFYIGIVRGIFLSAVASITYFSLNLILYYLDPNMAIIRKGFEVVEMNDFLLINTIYFYEMLVFGAIISFILVQRIKDKVFHEQYGE